MPHTTFSPLRRTLLAFAAVLALPTLPALAESLPMELSAPEAQARLARGELTLIDVRTPEEWRETGVAPGAARINIRHPAGSDGFLKDVLAAVKGDRNAPVALICRSGNRSTRAQDFLAKEGFTNVSNVTEGMSGGRAGPGWIARDLPIDVCKNC